MEIVDETSTSIDRGFTNANMVNPSRSTPSAHVDEADPTNRVFTTISARVDPKVKAKLIERAGELGVSPSTYLKRLVEEDLGAPAGSQRASIAGANPNPRAGRDLVLGVVRSFGAHRMLDCEHNERGICTYWGYRPEEVREDAESGLEFVRREEGLRAKVSPELCGLCDGYYVKPLARYLSRMRHAIKATLGAMGAEVNCKRCGDFGKLVYSDRQKVWVCSKCGEEPF
jgi:hypothetical protein